VTLEYRLRRASSGYWQWAIYEGDKMVSHWQGASFRGPHGEALCRERIALIMQAGADTPIRVVIST
jgi:hypothetical protein